MEHRGAVQTYLQRRFVTNNSQTANDDLCNLENGALMNLWVQVEINFSLEGRTVLTQSLDNLDDTSRWYANIFAAPFRHE